MGELQSFSKKVVIASDYVKKDGTSALSIYVSIDGKFDRIPLKLAWPATFFDKNSGQLVARYKGDQDFIDYKMAIDTELSKLNEIFKTYRLAQKKLTIGQLISDYYSYTSRNDFFQFWLNDVNERLKRRKIERTTRNGHVATLNKLMAFWKLEAPKKAKAQGGQPPMAFSDLTPKNLENFKAWLKSDQDNVASTAEKAMKDIRTYVRRALLDGNVFDDPFKVVKVAHPNTIPDVLTQEQLEALMKLFNDSDTPENWRIVLRHFLFSCFTGLRISDAKTVNHENIKGDWLVIMPVKTKRFHKVVRIPIHPMARQLVVTSLGKLFETYSDQYTNRLLAKISQAAEIDFKVTTHTARHTFGTLFIELGGDVVTLKDYMGHSKIETTMKYVHISERRRKEKILVFDKLFTTVKGGLAETA